MDTKDAIKVLGALAQETRLDAYRRLVQAGAEGQSAGDLATALGVPAPTLSFHLGQLTNAGLIVSRRAGRVIYYAADFERMTAVLAYLTENCCGSGNAALSYPCNSACDDPTGSSSLTRPSDRASSSLIDRSLSMLTSEALKRPYNVLFLCTGNSARSIMAEASLGRWGSGKFRAFSAGSHPAGQVNPMTLTLLQSLNYDTSGFRSKSWDEFSGPDAPPLDFVFTVCDNAANEVCPLWPGQPMTAHWGVPDPAAFVGPDDKKLRFFQRTYFELDNRIKIFTSLRFEALDQLSLQNRLREIGAVHLPTEGVVS